MNTSILFFGNSLHGDDGFGPAVYAALMTGKAGPIGAQLACVETAGLAALNYLDGCEEAVLVDAIHSDDPELLGQVVPFDPSSLCDEAHPCSSHAYGLPYLLRLLPIVFDGRAPRVQILGAFSQRPRAFCLSLSDTMNRAVDQAVRWLAVRYGLDAHPSWPATIGHSRLASPDEPIPKHGRFEKRGR